MKIKNSIAFILTQLILLPCWSDSFSLQKPWSDSNDSLLKLYQVGDFDGPGKTGALQDFANSHKGLAQVLASGEAIKRNSPLGLADFYHWIVRGRPQIHYNNFSELNISDSTIAELLQKCQTSNNSWTNILCVSKETQKFVASHRNSTPPADCKTAAELFGRSFEKLGLKGTASQAIDASMYTKKFMFGHTVNQIIVTGKDGTIYSYIIDAGNFPNSLYPYTEITSRFHEKSGNNLPQIDSPGVYRYGSEPSSSGAVSTSGVVK